MDTTNSAIDLRIWGKERGLPRAYPLLWHLADTAAVAGSLWDRFLTPNQRSLIAVGLEIDEEHARALVMLWAGLHDLGKATPGFQSGHEVLFRPLLADPAYGGERGSRKLRHERATQLTLDELLKESGYEATGVRVRSKRPSYRVAQILGGHHGRFCRHDQNDKDSRHLGKGGWDEQRRLFVKVLAEMLGNPSPPSRVDARAAVLISGLVVLADWLASQERFLTKQLESLPAEVAAHTVQAHFASLRAPAERLLAEAGLGLPQLRDVNFEEAFPFSPNPLQRSIIRELIPRLTGPGLLVVTAATGDGKTEAALLAARMLAKVARASGFYLALPTMATADEMYGRVRKFATRVAEGPAAMTLLHSMSWLTSAYQAQAATGLEGTSDVSSEDHDAHVVAPDWLRGRRRGLLAPLAVGTIDQALIAALSTKHNALRMLGLSGKVFIVDEAHAYDDYMQDILRKLLNWLGALRCPVILLSATLPASQVHELARSYRRGAGLPDDVPADVHYPGWLFVPAEPDQELVRISSTDQARVVANRQIDLHVDVEPVHHINKAEVDPGDSLDRRAVIRRRLSPLLTDKGCAAVICNTVDDAQTTYEMLRAWAGHRAEVRLLHARFPAYQREEITGELSRRLGKGVADRPSKMIIVATQVIEMSLDLDFDLVISDLAPIAQLLQRAGRCHRHSRDRFAWAAQPRLVVLDPRNGGNFAKPQHWGEIYHPYLLRATHLRLAGLTRIAVPEHVQEHVEAVHGPALHDNPILQKEQSEHRAESMARRQIAELGEIPDPEVLGDLAGLSEHDLPDTYATTRLGVESVRVLCCYLDADGRPWLDPGHRRPLPVRGSGDKGRFTSDDLREILKLTIPVRETILTGYEPPAQLPSRWQKTAWLRDVRALWFQSVSTGPLPISINGREVYLHADLGLIARRFV